MSQVVANSKVSREVIVHIITGVTVILKGIEKTESPGKLYLSSVLIVIGVIILAIGIFHTQVQGRFRNVHVVVLLAEAIVMGIIGYVYLHDGKSLIQYFCFAASLGFLIAFAIKLLKSAK